MKDPIKIALVVFAVSFTVLLLLLYLTRPSWVQVVDPNTGDVETSWSLLISYSLTFSLICAIAAVPATSSKGSRRNKPLFQDSDSLIMDAKGSSLVEA